MKKMLLICCGLALAVALQAQIIHVPADYPTIQQGINAATPGDTVLVAEGMYYEQINFKGKKPLVVASRFAVDGDTNHIRKTIIDGSQLTNLDSASVVYFISGEDTTSILCGFTIMRGKGTHFTLLDLTWRAGAGIFIDGSGAKIIHNHITENRLVGTQPDSVQIVSGAGLFCQWNLGNHWVVIDHNVINHNSCYLGSAESSGAGLELTYNSRITYNIISDNTCTVGLNGNAVGSGFLCGVDPSWNPKLSSIIQHNIIKNNLAESLNANSAGAVGVLQAVTGIFSDNEVSGNQSRGPLIGGLIIVEPKPGTVLRNNIFNENSGKGSGGGLFLGAYSNPNPSEVLIKNNYFICNIVTKNGSA